MSKTVLVTGSSRGIGRAIALKYASLGFSVVINCARSLPALKEVEKEIKALGAPCLAVCADVGKKEDCIRLFEEISKTFGSVDILVNNAGISRVGLLQDMGFEEWDNLIAANLSSVFHCCKLSIPSMIQKQAGHIINISSVWGVCGASCEAAYSASKGGVNALTKALAKELAPSHIQVNAIACGAIDTDMNHFLSEEEASGLLEEIPAGRMGTPDEVARMVLSLTESPAYLTGQVIKFDGGWI
ncbi:SDR family oxidoreductase [Lachnospiraceae bacterium 45-P1]